MTPFGSSAFTSRFAALFSRHILVGIALGHVAFHMLRASQGDQVLWTIVLLVAVYMVDVLIRAKPAAVSLLPIEAMLQHLSTLVGKVVPRHIDGNVTTGSYLAPTLPPWIELSTSNDGGMMALEVLSAWRVDVPRPTGLSPFWDWRSAATSAQQACRYATGRFNDARILPAMAMEKANLAIFVVRLWDYLPAAAAGAKSHLQILTLEM